MSMRFYVTLLRDKNDKTYQKYLKIHKACNEAKIDPPKEVDEYFGGCGVDNDLEEPLEIDFDPKEWKTNYQDGYEIDVDNLPEGVKTIRFVVSY